MTMFKSNYFDKNIEKFNFNTLKPGFKGPVAQI